LRGKKWLFGGTSFVCSAFVDGSVQLSAWSAAQLQALVATFELQLVRHGVAVRQLAYGRVATGARGELTQRAQIRGAAGRREPVTSRGRLVSPPRGVRALGAPQPRRGARAPQLPAPVWVPATLARRKQPPRADGRGAAEAVRAGPMTRRQHLVSGTATGLDASRVGAMPPWLCPPTPTKRQATNRRTSDATAGIVRLVGPLGTGATRVAGPFTSPATTGAGLGRPLPGPYGSFSDFVDWDVVRELRTEFAGVRLADRFDVAPRAIDGGTVHVIRQPSNAALPSLPTAHLVAEALASRLDLVRGIGPVRSTRMWQAGVRRIDELGQHHPSLADEVEDVLADLDALQHGEARPLIDRLRARLGGAGHLLATLLAGTVALEQMAFLDVETLGLDNNPIFLVGVGRVRDGSLVVEQHFAPSVSDEPAMLASAAQAMAGVRLVVSYNGRSADVRWLAQRCLYHGVAPFCELAHLDLLYAARRRWQRDEELLTDARLPTVQVELLGMPRPARDVPGWLIPNLYHEYSRDPASEGILVPVVEHNRVDIEALPMLLERCCEAALERAGLLTTERGS
jgi:uncharacterized protein YprB with RNaseH-like and TPR domain